MNSQKRKKVVYVLFALAVIYGFYNLKDEFSKKSAELAPVSQEQITPQVVILPAKTINIEQYSKLSWGRDPFYRAKGSGPVSSNDEQTEWILNGILYDKKTSTAVINKKIVRVGDKINGAKVINITKTKVVLKKGNSDIFTLHITKEKS